MATYHVKEIRSVSRYHIDIPELASGLPRRSAAEAWLIDYCRANKLQIIDREVDEENDAIDFMAIASRTIMRQFAVEPDKQAA